MSIALLLVFVMGLCVGWFIGNVSLLFFQEEIFNFIDGLVYRVRRFFGLEV